MLCVSRTLKGFAMLGCDSRTEFEVVHSDDVECCGQLLDACSTEADCGVGLYCSSCATANATASRCVREDATPLTNV